MMFRRAGSRAAPRPQRRHWPPSWYGRRPSSAPRRRTHRSYVSRARIGVPERTHEHTFVARDQLLPSDKCRIGHQLAQGIVRRARVEEELRGLFCMERHEVRHRPATAEERTQALVARHPRDEILAFEWILQPRFL